MTERCCNFGFFIDLLVSKNAFMRGSSEEGDRNSGVEDVDMGFVKQSVVIGGGCVFFR